MQLFILLDNNHIIRVGMFQTGVITYASIMNFVKLLSKLWLHIATFLLQIQVKIEISISWYHILCLGYAYCSFCIVRGAQVMFIVGVAHCVTKVPLRDFDFPWKRYYKAHEIEKYPFLAHTCGITSIQNFGNFFPFILFLENSRWSASFVYVAD
jgi:hypothetical protein